MIPTDKWLEHRISHIEIFYQDEGCNSTGWIWQIEGSKSDGSSRCFDFGSEYYDTPQKAFNAAIKLLKKEGLIK